MLIIVTFNIPYSPGKLGINYIQYNTLIKMSNGFNSLGFELSEISHDSEVFMGYGK